MQLLAGRIKTSLVFRCLALVGIDRVTTLRIIFAVKSMTIISLCWYGIDIFDIGTEVSGKCGRGLFLESVL